MEFVMRIEAPAAFVGAVGAAVEQKVLAPGSVAGGIMTANRKNSGPHPDSTKEEILERVRNNTADAVQRFHDSAKRISRT